MNYNLTSQQEELIHHASPEVRDKFVSLRRACIDAGVKPPEGATYEGDREDNGVFVLLRIYVRGCDVGTYATEDLVGVGSSSVFSKELFVPGWWIRSVRPADEYEWVRGISEEDVVEEIRRLRVKITRSVASSWPNFFRRPDLADIEESADHGIAS